MWQSAGMPRMPTRTTFLERYLKGEHEQVWAELHALGKHARDEPLFTDALSVARETMRRARHNIEVLVPRLQSLGYIFGYAWLTERAHERFTIEITILMSDFGDPDNPGEGPAQARVGIAPDWYHKYFISGGGPYFITTPCLAADAPLEGVCFEITFVEYLRTCFRWAGFPGLAQAPKPPLDDIATLTRGLLSL